MGLGDLQPLERVAAQDGETIVLSVTLLADLAQVFNLEIHGEHVYQVTSLGVLVHNGDLDVPGDPLCGVISAGPKRVFGLSKATKLGSYADSDLAQRALDFRKASGIRRKGNVAVIEYELNGQKFIKEFHTVGEGNRHSEFLVKDFLPERATLKRLFSERQPCDLRIPNCDRMLGRDFPNAEITFLIEYSGTGRQAGNAALDALLRELGL